MNIHARQARTVPGGRPATAHSRRPRRPDTRSWTEAYLRFVLLMVLVGLHVVSPDFGWDRPVGAVLLVVVVILLWDTWRGRRRDRRERDRGQDGSGAGHA